MVIGSDKARATANTIASRLREPRGRALRDFLSSGRTLLTGRPRRTAPPEPEPEAAPETAGEAPVETGSTTLPEPAAVDDSLWPEPPIPIGTSHRLSDHYDTGARPPRFDVELFEQLNQEYASKRIVTNPPSYQADDLAAAARRRVRWVHSMVDLQDKRLLEIGCGSGFELWHAAHGLGALADGVDVVEWSTWKQLADERTRFTCTDLAAHNPFDTDTFDRIMSFTVWEHVVHPHHLLEETYKVLKPGGIAWIRANLYRGPQASHRYRDIYFPWPHLLFSDDVIAEWDRRHGRETKGSAWVNRMTWTQYEYAFQRIGFHLQRCSFVRTPIDEGFYQRFGDVLGRYPRSDLTRDFFLAVLRKPASEQASHR